MEGEGQCAEGFVAAGSSSEPRCLDVKQAARVWNVAGASPRRIALTLPAVRLRTSINMYAYRHISRRGLRRRRRRYRSVGGARGAAALPPLAALRRTRAAALLAPLARTLSGLQFAALLRPPARLTCTRRTQKSSEREAQEWRRTVRGTRERRPKWPRQRLVDLISAMDIVAIYYILRNFIFV